MLPHDRRSSTRLESGHLVIHSEAENEPQSQCLGMAVTLDVNEFGLRMQSTERFEIGERFRFSIALEEDVIQAVGRVVHVTETLNSTFEIGVEFLDIAAPQIERIRKYMAARKTS